VYGRSRVSGQVRMYGDARVCGRAHVSGDARFGWEGERHDHV